MNTAPNDRDVQIINIISRLEQLRPHSEREKYAIEQNVAFFKSIRSVALYLQWVFGVRKHIRREDLLEINELLAELDEIFHAKMAEIERRPNPGIVTPAVDFVTDHAIHISHGERVRLVSLGSGSMEIERQAIERLQKGGYTSPMTIVGLDLAPNARVYAEKNLRSLVQVRVVQETQLTEERMFSLEKETKESVLVIIADNDIFSLASEFTPHVFDLSMTLLLLHHLSTEKRIQLVNMMRIVASHTLNYDGYRSEIAFLFLSLTGWHSPIFLNAAVFSTVRFPSKSEVVHLHSNAQITFYKHGHYRAIFPA